MKKTHAFLAGRILATASLAITAFAFGSASADIPSYATKSADQGFRDLSQRSHCDDDNRDAPNVSSSNASKFASLAQTCLSAASGGRIDRAANSAYNAAQLYFALGAAEDPNRAASISYFQQAISAAERSANLLPASNVGSGREENRLKFERARIVAASYALLGLNEMPRTERVCGARTECLTQAISLIDGNANGLGVANASGDYRVDAEKLRVLRAVSAAELVEIEGSGSLSRVISDLGTAAAALSNTGGSQTAALVASEARTMLVELVTAEADGILEDADSEIDVQNAINTLENGITSVRRAGGTDIVAANLYAQQGDAYLKLAEFDDSDANTTAFCSAAAAYLNADQLGGVSDAALRGLVGQGLSLTKAFDAGAETCPTAVMRGEASTDLAAINAYEEARQTVEPGGALDASSYVQLAKLYLGQADPDQQLIDDLLARATSGPVSGTDLAAVYVDIASAKIPAIGSSAKDIQDFCRDENSGVQTNLNTAREADPNSPEVLFALGRTAYLCGANRGSADAFLDAALDEAKPESAWRELRAKAEHHRSLRLLEKAMARSSPTSRIDGARDAADLSEIALSFDPSEPAFRLQACRARLAGPQLLATIGAERSQCAISSRTNEGTLLDVLMALRTAKTQFTQSNGANYPAFGDARDTIMQSRGRIENSIDTSEADEEFQWPGMAQPLRYLEVVDYGAAIARACSIQDDSLRFVQPPSDPGQLFESFFVSYNVFGCEYADKNK